MERNEFHFTGIETSLVRAGEHQDEPLPENMTQNNHRRSKEAGSNTTRRRFLQTATVAGTGLATGCLGVASGTGTTLTMGYQP
ncbi:hypothetical protein C447_09127, partial [Halococcus hamelinensis 100A6]